MNQKKIPMLSKRYNDARIDIFLNCLDNFLTDVKDQKLAEEIAIYFKENELISVNKIINSHPHLGNLLTLSWGVIAQSIKA